MRSPEVHKTPLSSLRDFEQRVSVGHLLTDPDWFSLCPPECLPLPKALMVIFGCLMNQKLSTVLTFQFILFCFKKVNENTHVLNDLPNYIKLADVDVALVNMFSESPIDFEAYRAHYPEAIKMLYPFFKLALCHVAQDSYMKRHIRFSVNNFLLINILNFEYHQDEYDTKPLKRLLPFIPEDYVQNYHAFKKRSLYKESMGLDEDQNCHHCFDQWLFSAAFANPSYHTVLYQLIKKSIECSPVLLSALPRQHWFRSEESQYCMMKLNFINTLLGPSSKDVVNIADPFIKIALKQLNDIRDPDFLEQIFINCRLFPSDFSRQKQLYFFERFTLSRSGEIHLLQELCPLFISQMVRHPAFLTYLQCFLFSELCELEVLNYCQGIHEDICNNKQEALNRYHAFLPESRQTPLYTRLHSIHVLTAQQKDLPRDIMTFRGLYQLAMTKCHPESTPPGTYKSYRKMLQQRGNFRVGNG